MRFVASPFWVFAVTLAACTGPSGTDGQSGPKGDPGAPGGAGASVTVASVDPGGACSAGGASLTSASGTAYVCNGTRGDQGANGDPGMAGTSVTVAALGTGSACIHGGSQLSDGTTVSLACNGAPGLKGDKGDKGDPGAPGSDGFRVLLRGADGTVLGVERLAFVHVAGVGCSAYLRDAGFAPPNNGVMYADSNCTVAFTSVEYVTSNTKDGLLNCYGDAGRAFRIRLPLVATSIGPSNYFMASSSGPCSAGSPRVWSVYPLDEVTFPTVVHPLSVEITGAP